jgi:hypothetical protein
MAPNPSSPTVHKTEPEAVVCILHTHLKPVVVCILHIHLKPVTESH